MKLKTEEEKKIFVNKQFEIFSLQKKEGVEKLVLGRGKPRKF